HRVLRRGSGRHRAGRAAPVRRGPLGPGRPVRPRGRPRLAGGAPAGVRGRAAGRAGAARRGTRPSGARRPRLPPTAGRPPRPARDRRRVPGGRGRARGDGPGPLRPPQHGPLPAAPDRRDRRAGPHPPARRLGRPDRAGPGPHGRAAGARLARHHDPTGRRRGFVGILQTRWSDLVGSAHLASAPERGRVERVLVVVAPGQGSQTPGFLTPWLELPGFRDRMAWLSAVAGLDLIAHGTTSDADTIKDTAVAQPLIVASGLVSLLALFEHPADGFQAVGVGAGHSVGEITGASAAGVLTAEQAMVFVRERGRAMAAASAVTPTGMSAVLGGDPEEVLAVLERHGLTPANMNGAGQVVAAGTLEQLEALKADPPTRARVIPLAVAGAFHTHHMAPAVDTLAGYARAISTHDPRLRLVSNADGAVVQDGREVLRRL